MKGRKLYIPPVVIEEAESIQSDEGLFSRAEALKKMSNYSKIGRMVEKSKNKKPKFDIYEGL